ncbi:MAG TPA: hypothetical protein VGM41_00020 [Chitinophagaceae bacterium]|jgi:hypothetical protein
MKYSNYLLVVALFVGLAGCKKDSVTLSPLASLNIVNASVNLGTVKVNFTGLKGLYSSISTTVAYGANTAYGANAGVTVPVTIVPADTTQTAFSGNFSFVTGGIYSFYLAGQSTAVDTILVKENIPSYTDSSCGVRFINLSYNSSPVVVTLASSITTNEFSSTPYKQMSGFKKYPALVANGTYAFTVRDASTNALIASYTLTTPRFFNCTLALKGMIGGTGTSAIGVMRVNNY